MSDVWEDESNEVLEQRLRERELTHAKNRMETLGYKDGVDVGVDKDRQMGFEDGFRVGKSQGNYKGKLLGLCSCVKSENPTEVLHIISKIEELEVNKIQNYDMVKNMEFIQNLEMICKKVGIDVASF
jgi:hypothetical protein